ncbi:MAG: 3-deoxy-manno-octulosonate cytidylyltransferase [Gemmatimonadaceae bacterium]
MSTLVVIPARLAAVRLPRKPLRLLAGLPLIVRVWQRVSSMDVADACVVATDDESVAKAARDAGADVVMTSDAHTSGTERVAEVARQSKFKDFSTIVNIQGDEPFIGCAAVKGATNIVSTNQFPIGTAAAPARWDISNDPSIVKVVRADDGRAMYFSRGPIPFPRDGVESTEIQPLQHIGVYAYSRDALDRWVALPPHELELTERLEQLRPLAAGIPIGVAIADEQPAVGIDTEEDLSRANARWDAFIAGR